MEDNRDKLIPAQLAGYTWELSGYASKVPFANEDSLTMREVRNVFQLDPEPPQMELNDYICEAVRKRDLSYFSFFLHHFEKRLNGVITVFLPATDMTAMTRRGFWTTSWKFCKCCCFACRGSTRSRRQNS